jgi:asparagine synthase (glutamine-hydrolysing)
MCGIFCTVNTNKLFSSHEIEKFNDSLKMISYRGPDACGKNIYDTSNSKGQIYFGHNRLSIIDMNASSNQPMTYLNHYHIIFNGEIYNYIELREKLMLKGYIFNTKSDTEVVLALYAEKGVEGFSELNGMWAFIIYDELKNVIICSRDRFGEKPLYYFQDSDGTTYFASEIKQILPFIKAKCNEKILKDYLNYYLIDHTDETFFEGIFKIPASGYLEINCLNGSYNFGKYWKISLHDDYKDISLEEASTIFKNLFEDAIKIRLRSDVKIGNTLSGGLDSSSIAVLADKILKNKILNLAVTNSSKHTSEEFYVDLLINDNKLDVEKISYDNANPWDDVEDVIYHHDEPILSISTIAHYQMMRLLKQKTDITVVLSGQGGDEAFGGYNKYFYYALREKIRNMDLIGFCRDGFHVVSKIGKEFTLNAARRYTGILGNQGVQFNKILTNPANKNQLLGAKNFKNRQIDDYYKYSVPPLCHYEDRNSMAFSKEIRLPFLDHRLVEFTINLPIQHKINNGFTKYVLRDSMTELPSLLRWRRDKKGFTLDEELYYSGNHLNTIRNFFKDSALAKMGYINHDELLKTLSENKPKIWVRDLGRLIFAEIWLKKFIC